MTPVSEAVSGRVGRGPSVSADSESSDPHPRCLSADPEARVRAVLGGDGRHNLPPVNPATLLRYYQYLSSRLPLPFRARHCPETSGIEQTITIVSLLDPREWDAGGSTGLLCEAMTAEGRSLIVPLVEAEVRPGHIGFQLIEDYWYWFWNWRNRSVSRWAV